MHSLARGRGTENAHVSITKDKEIMDAVHNCLTDMIRHEKACAWRATGTAGQDHGITTGGEQHQP